MPTLTEEAKEAMRQYHRDWRKKNKDKSREYRERYWNKRAKAEAEAKGEETSLPPSEKES